MELLRFGRSGNRAQKVVDLHMFLTALVPLHGPMHGIPAYAIELTAGQAYQGHSGHVGKAPIFFHFFEKAGKMRKFDEKFVSSWQQSHETDRLFEALPDRS